MKRLKGFTLVELVITIAIIVILSTIGVIISNDYIYKAKTAEGYALLSQIRDAEMRHYNEYEGFWGDSRGNENKITSIDNTLNIDARTNKYYTAFNTGTSSPWRYYYTSYVAGNKVPTIYMYFNLTSGATYYVQY